MHPVSLQSDASMKAKHSLNGPIHYTHIVYSLLVRAPVKKELDYIGFPFI
jgi:hypothetical protein